MAIMNLKKEQNVKKIKVKTLPVIIAESVFASMKLFVIPEFRFHKERQWRADYFIPDLKLLIEIEGGVFGYGRHNRATGYLRDLEKYNAANENGYHLLRYATHEIEKTNGQNIVDSLKRFIENKKMAGVKMEKYCFYVDESLKDLKPGDKVLVKSVEWYHKNEKCGEIENNRVYFKPGMFNYLEKILTIEECKYSETYESIFYKLENSEDWSFYPWMLEKKVENNEKSFKNDLGKPMMNLLPFESLEPVAMVLNHGAKTYGKNTWQLIENPEERYEAALLRHLTAHKKGEKFDKESGLSHLSHLACNALFLLWFELQKEKKDD